MEKKSMNMNELVARTATATALSKATTRAVIERAFNEIAEEMRSGGSVRTHWFVFDTTMRKAGEFYNQLKDRREPLPAKRLVKVSGTAPLKRLVAGSTDE